MSADNFGRSVYALVKWIGVGHRLRVFFLALPFRCPERFNGEACAIVFSALQVVNPQIGKIA
jgi:hypothetical protein